MPKSFELGIKTGSFKFIGHSSTTRCCCTRNVRIFSKNKVNILDCLFKLLRQYQFNGHPFYYSALKELEKVSGYVYLEVENILSIPLWFNRFLKTNFDADISKAGYNFVKDIFPEHIDCQTLVGLSGYKSRKLGGIMCRVPTEWKEKILAS